MVDPWREWDEIALADPAELSGPERLLYAIGWLRTEINDGGFDQLFFNSAGDVVPEAVAAARAAGATDLAELVERAMAVLGPEYPMDRQRRQEVLVALSDADVDRLGDLAENYFDLEASTDLDEVMRTAWLGG